MWLNPYKLLLLLSLSFVCINLQSQEKKKGLDSLEKELSAATTDKTKAKALINLASYAADKDTTKMLAYLREAFVLSKKVDEPSYIAQCHSFFGFYYEKLNDYPLSEAHYDTAITIFKRLGKWDKLADAYGEKGFIYVNTGEFDKALGSQLSSLQYKDSTGNLAEMSITLNSIGNIYVYMKEYEKAKSYYRQSLTKKIQAGDSAHLHHAYHNLGIVLKSLHQYDSALYYFHLAKENLDRQGNEGLSARLLESIGILHHEMGDYNKALEAFEKAKLTYIKIGDKVSLGYINSAIGTNYNYMKQYGKAVPYLKQGIEIAKQLKESRLLLDALSSLSEAYGMLHNYEQAYAVLKERNILKDSLYNADRSSQIAEMETKYQTKQKELENQKLKTEKEKERTEKLLKEKELKTSQKTQRLLILVLVLAAGIVVVVLVMLRKLKKSNVIITEQKEEVERINKQVIHQRDLVEEKNKEIVDSIQYAKRLQEAILPPAKIVKEWLQESFILYKPKDIVAGDFYWLEKPTPTPNPSHRKGNKNSTQQVLPNGEELGGASIFFAAADCTGHGVPGAMVSVVCSNALSKALIEEKITDPGKLLDRTRELVIDRFGKSEEDIKDGMDIALVSLGQRESERGERTLQFAGANNPLWIVRHGAEEVEEIKADKQPIGKYAAEKPFTTHEVQLNKGDAIYIFSDGYVDQFGGVKGKKYKSGNLKKFLLSIRDHDMTTQRELLHEEFENWKGDIGQIDDVCIIGVRV